MKKRSHHNYKPLAGGRQHDDTLRPWAEVARIYSERTGDRVTPKNALQIANNGMQKIALALQSIAAEVSR